MSTINRVTGMATGMDTDATVKKMMAPYQSKLDKLNQNKQLVQWKQDAYRDIVGDLNTFKSSYLDYLKADNNMLSPTTYAGFDVSTVDVGTTNASTGVSATATVGAVAGNYKVDFTGGHLATAAELTSGGKIQTTTDSTDAVASTELSKIMDKVPTSIDISYNNGTGVKVKTITINEGMTLGALAQKINMETSSEVLASFSELTGKFTIKTSNAGAKADTLSITPTAGSDFLDKLKLGSAVPGSDLSVLITPPGGSPTLVTKATNKFAADGITYNFTSDKNKDGTALISNINVTANVQKPYDKIKNFIDKYNEAIDKIQTKIDEKPAKGYLPLTDEQKKAMSADDIKAWEVKAKAGLLKNDSILSNMLTSMRSAFYSGVEGAGITLSEIGLSTSDDTTQRGKINIDETKLKDALQNRGNQVVSLFSKPSSKVISYSSDLTATDRINRNNGKKGIFQRIKDILEDNIKVTGKKGMIIQKAGIKGDFTNLLSKDMTYKQKYIEDMVKKMSDKETQYYNQFAKLETAMNKMNTQSSWLTQQVSKM